MPYTKNYPGGWQPGAGGGTPITAATLDNIETQYDEAIKIVRKTADETVNNSAVLQNDDELLFAMAANEVWEVRIIPKFESSNVAKIQFAWTVPVACFLSGVAWGHDQAAADFIDVALGTGSTVLLFGTGGAGVNDIIGMIWLLVVNGANAGNFQLQWAQLVAEATDTKVKVSSIIIAHKIA